MRHPGRRSAFAPRLYGAELDLCHLASDPAHCALFEKAVREFKEWIASPRDTNGWAPRAS